jgi:hypothetical protein
MLILTITWCDVWPLRGDGRRRAVGGKGETPFGVYAQTDRLPATVAVGGEYLTQQRAVGQSHDVVVAAPAKGAVQDLSAQARARIARIAQRDRRRAQQHLDGRAGGQRGVLDASSSPARAAPYPQIAGQLVARR